MTLLLDSHEADELYTLLAQCVPVRVERLNDEGLPDIWYMDHEGRQVGWENKQAGEALGGLDALEEQLQRECENVDYLGLTIRGVITPTPDGYCETWVPAKDNPRILVKHKVFYTYYSAYATFTDRLERTGVVVKEAPSLDAFVQHMVATYKNAQQPQYEHKTMMRLVVVKRWLAELDQDKARFAKQVMACVPGVGEEIALALADRFPSIVTLINTLESGADKEIAALPLRTGKRTIGPSAVMKMKGALGL